LNLGINWIIRIRCGFENSSRIAIASNRVTPDCLRFCPCCGHEEQSFQHWILECPIFSQHRTKSLSYLDDFYRLFFNKYNNLFVIHLTPALKIRKTIHNYIFTFLLGGILVFNELKIDKAEQRYLNEQLYSSSGSHGAPTSYRYGKGIFLQFLTQGQILVVQQTKTSMTYGRV